MPAKITPVNLSASGQVVSTWSTVDVSAYVTAGATGVALVVVNKVAASYAFGVRKKGSTDTYAPNIGVGTAHLKFVGINASDEFEIYYDSGDETNYDMWLVLEFGAEATFPTNLVSLGAMDSSNFSAVNIATETGADTATAAIVYASTYRFFVRPTGSTDAYTDYGTTVPSFAIVGCDGSEEFEARDGAAATLYLVGYLTDGYTSHANGISRSTATTGSFQALATQSGAVAYAYQVMDAIGYDTISVREQSSSMDPYSAMQDGYSGQLIAGGPAEQKISNTNVDLYEVGFFFALGEASGLLRRRRSN